MHGPPKDFEALSFIHRSIAWRFGHFLRLKIWKDGRGET